MNKMNELNNKEDKQLEEAIWISKQSYKLGESSGSKYNTETTNLQKGKYTLRCRS